MSPNLGGLLYSLPPVIYQGTVWKAAKRSTFLQNRKARLAKDLSPAIKERRIHVWPLVAKACEQEKEQAFATETELFPAT